MPDRLTESHDRLLLALERLLQEAQRAGDPGVREWASLAMLDAIDFAEELGMMWDDEAERRRAAVRRVWRTSISVEAHRRLVCVGADVAPDR